MGLPKLPDIHVILDRSKVNELIARASSAFVVVSKSSWLVAVKLLFGSSVSRKVLGALKLAKNWNLPLSV